MNYRSEIITKIAQNATVDKKTSPKPIQEIFGKLIYNDTAQRKTLPKKIYGKLKKTIENFEQLDPKIADDVALAMKNWALSQGATHYSHWFQPLTGSTAEKHDSFLDLQDGHNPIMEFSGKQLIKGEPDASSFPSGGIRQTFEARGYTIWDATSPAFIQSTRYGKTLFIPSAFMSYSGEILDMKTPLLKSLDTLSKNATKLLNTIGHNVSWVTSTVGLEQEYFLIDNLYYSHRPDMVSSGRTLFGSSPLKGQELSDHYFGSINKRVLEFMQDSEMELYKLGIPIKTRHNEVAPNQFELAQVFTQANLAVDHNLLTMSVMKSIAKKHGLRMITHEKPFKGINGSGKHCNWSLVDSHGHNLLDPGKTPQENLVFMTILAAIVRAIDLRAPLLRISIASLGNDHRLGGFEAPPAIISVYLGDQLTKIVNLLIGNKVDADKTNNNQLKLGVSTLPPLRVDNSDRNRTSPFAYTGNKFEFRALGANQNPSSPNFTLNLAIAESFDFINEQIKNKLKTKPKLNEAVQEVIKEVFTKHQRIMFNGDGYSEEWIQEAEKRGLPNLTSLVEAVATYDNPESVKLFEKYNVLSKSEIIARQNVRYEKFITEVQIECRSMIDIIRTMVIPAAVSFQEKLASSIHHTESVLGNKLSKQRQLLNNIATKTEDISTMLDEFVTKSTTSKGSNKEQAEYMQFTIRPLMTTLRQAVDDLELCVDDNIWPLPKYREMLGIL